jgi:signal recognition particle GTPase
MVRRLEGIINSMTPQERAKPELIKASASAASPPALAFQVQEVNRLLNQFEQTQKMMKQFSKGGMQDDARHEGHAAGHCADAQQRGLGKPGRLLVVPLPFPGCAHCMLGYSGLPRLPL